MATSFCLEARTEASAKNGGFSAARVAKKNFFQSAKWLGGNILRVAVAHFIKTCIIHTPKKLSKACAVFYKWSDPYERIRGGSGGGLWLEENLSDLHGKAEVGLQSPVSPHFAIISSASQRDIVLGDKWERSARAQTVRGRSPPSPSPPTLLSHDPERCRRVLPDNHNCVLKPLIKFRSLEWYCFAMNPYEKRFTLGDYGGCVGAGGGS